MSSRKNASARSGRTAFAGGLAGTFQDRSAVGWVGRHLERLFEESDRALRGTEVHRSVRRSDQREPRLDRHRIAFGSVRRCLPCGEVVDGQRAGQLVLAEPFEEPAAARCRARRSRFASVP